MVWDGIGATLAPFHEFFPSILSKIHELYRIINDLSEPTKKSYSGPPRPWL
jgi:hypothetical protein